MGWIVANPSLGQVVENMIQYSTSGVAQFMQRAGVVALDQGEDFVAQQVARARASRDIACEILAKTGRCRFTPPQGAFYLFFSVDGETDSAALARRLVDEAQVGLAPGTAFGAGGEHFLRLCFAREPEQIRDACERIARVLA
jgi:aspartate/methionine/tyrosine aminotransferase